MAVRFGLLAVAALALAACGQDATPIQATGSSTVYPFTKAVAERFVEADTSRIAPRVESTGTEPGFRKFCAALGGGAPDIANASRRINGAEFDICQANGVREIVEVPIGLDGIALAESVQGPKIGLSRKDIYLALAANPMGEPNAARTWRDVNAALPPIPIKVLGPPATSGTRQMFVELMLEPGCLDAMPDARALRAGGDPAMFDRTCRQIRADGAYVSEGENDSVIVQALERDPQALGLFGYSYLEENANRLRGVPIDGVAPDYAAISGGRYAGGRTLYLYVKKKRLESREDLKAFVDLYATMWDPGGPLTERGLIAMSDRGRKLSRDAIRFAEPLQRSRLQ